VPRELPDLRTVVLAVFGWAGALVGAGHGLAPPLIAGGVLAAGAAGLWRQRGRGAGLAVLAGVVVFGAVATASGVRYERVTNNPLTELARLRSGVVLTGRVVDDPRALPGRFGEAVLVRVDARQVLTSGRIFRLREPVLVFGRGSWSGVPLGSTVSVTGHLGVASGSDVAAVMSTSSPPDIRAGPDP
jgi:competence protein ComEC